MNNFDTLARQLAPYYSRFDVSNRLLFSSHSHQAWPDCAELGLLEAFADAALHIDDKWSKAFEKTEVLRQYLRNWYDDPTGRYCLASNTHQLIVSWLSSLPLKQKPRIVTSDGEFHSLHRQLHRLEAEGVEVVWVSTFPLDTFAERFSRELDENTAAAALSRVFFGNSMINRELNLIAQAARDKGVPMLVDDYHGTHVSPLSLRDEGLEDCFLVTGGYKYLQWGEGNCFLRFPNDCEFEPVITGWYSSFSTLDGARDNQSTQYDNNDQRFAGATYDPSSQYRAARVVEFFEKQNLDKKTLEENYRAQIRYLHAGIGDMNLDKRVLDFAHSENLDNNAGFLALTSPHAQALQAALSNKGVMSDSRGNTLRLGPAPFTQSQQIDQMLERLAESIAELN